MSSNLKQKLITCFKRSLPQCHIKIVIKSTNRLSPLFCFEDVILKEIQSHIKYSGHFRPKLVHWNKSVYCAPIDRALKMRFNEGSGSFLRPAIPEWWRFLWNQLRRVLDKINTQQFFVTKYGFLASKKYNKIQFFVKRLQNIYFTKAKRRTLSMFTKNTQI